ncbi:MAG: hypothetical protein Q8R28_10990, partial [Dehalococcoidia bacterium]|nr:hypothetical protein [Dehalococcoidia bacterium]
MQVPGSLSKNVKAIGYHDLSNRPGFKMAVQQVGERWYMYLGHFWHRGWSILDVTDPRRPELVRFMDGPDNTFTLQVQVADGLLITGLEKVGAGIQGREHVWGGDPNQPFGEGVLIWDLKDPVEPKLLGRFSTGGNGTHRNFYPGGRYLYLAANMRGYQGNILVIVDIGDPSNPVEVSRWWYPGQWVEGNEKAFFPKPHYSAYHHGPAYTAANKLYLAYGRAGMIILDVDDIRHPRLVGRMDIGDFGSIIGVHTVLPLPERQIALLTMEAILEDDRDPLNFVLVVDIKDEARPKPMASFPVPEPPPELGIADFQDKGGKFGPHNIHLPHHQECLAPVEDLVAVTYESAGLWFFDISNPGLPKAVGYFIPDDPKVRLGLLPRSLATQTEDVLIDARGYIYITDKN